MIPLSGLANKGTLALLQDLASVVSSTHKAPAGVPTSRPASAVDSARAADVFSKPASERVWAPRYTEASDYAETADHRKENRRSAFGKKWQSQMGADADSGLSRQQRRGQMRVQHQEERGSKRAQRMTSTSSVAADTGTDADTAEH